MTNDNNTVKSNGVKRQLTGFVTSNKMTQTIVVKVESVKVHPKYHKRYKVFKKYAAHTDGDAKVYTVGQKVTIEEVKPYSKTVNWRVV
ncbi:MAG: 30S ribosomal protein S17 [Candidatus Doudnabacteria bacterium RIFCSPLOWO2_02_FULL_42_9]|uniref:30S ribosomal protein S17 n=1 Tax=Candidatus Doudnabacteria bacterium RIFCSPHIGHO2_01_FULL_41_86 TaxID=1817821 RepID=A0A1F5N997_9BACT|nr:ribosomal protein S17 [uncultured bacterium]OGE74237.1 MAG: 30S ribosomal protein S17 [Candidatus Doudnabacteria bacterium RIFCSPHIGHO2_01_FULL_41_86]OGE75017.1 MAG: 30S ribosomal protein S17 [Candidatus Doudnabacteria bacterium RIFCSPHIGHO2_01_43_10]OGE85276.1 MAG: 30S ribosomal protein S17 [Candidatus Doudnabacteria bacterium RIFCSPHIGHO2_12_FULL_42_22]OGE86814.1 MAG: 30S ribosomal protein S17 [Candidatus Doudnabacteria bacterium RIFCSPHIGHO2_02_FULL_42_25]OGE92413.1 MAG: 30S ribosomal pr